MCLKEELVDEMEMDDNTRPGAQFFVVVAFLGGREGGRAFGL